MLWRFAERGCVPAYGFKANKAEVRPGMFRSVLAVNEHEATVVRELFQLYVANNGAKSVARELNRRGRWYRKGKPWSKDLVLKVLEESAVAGTYWWAHPWSDGTTAIVYEPLELIERLVALVPPPGFHRVRFHGVLAPTAPERPDVVPATCTSKGSKPKNYCWAELMKRAYDLDVLVCPRCSGKMRVLATIMKPDAIRAILEACGLPADSPPQAPAVPLPDETGDWEAA